jgi:hypothetical protein
MTLPTAALAVNTSLLNKSLNLTLRFMVERVNQNSQRVERDLRCGARSNVRSWLLCRRSERSARRGSRGH